MGIGQEWATEANAPQVEKPLHTRGVRNRGAKLDFFMFTPPSYRMDGDRTRIAPIRCGQCKTEIPDGERHCPHCWGEEEL